MPVWGSWSSEVPKGWVRIGTGPDFFITVRLTGTPAITSKVYGGWEPIKRPREGALVEWLGHDPRQLDVPIMFDGLLNHLNGEPNEPPWGGSVERDIRILEHLTIKEPKYNSPPRLRVKGDLVPHNNLEWVINDIAWAGDDVRRPTDGARTRASAVITFLEYVDIQLIKASRKHKAKGKAVRTTSKKGKYKVKPGDTTKKIARKELGSASRYTEIHELNGIRDGSAIAAGEELRMPA